MHSESEMDNDDLKIKKNTLELQAIMHIQVTDGIYYTHENGIRELADELWLCFHSQEINQVLLMPFGSWLPLQ
jgi:hypothetical protein